MLYITYITYMTFQKLFLSVENSWPAQYPAKYKPKPT